MNVILDFIFIGIWVIFVCNLYAGVSKQRR